MATMGRLGAVINRNITFVGVEKAATPSNPYGGRTVYGNTIHNQVLACCGLASIEGFGSVAFSNFAEKSAYLAEVYAQNPRARNYIYLVNRGQHGGKDGKGQKAQEHALFLEIGAKLIHSFTNLNSPNDLFIYIVDIAAAIGPYLDSHGGALKVDPFLKEKEAAKKLAKEQREANIISGKIVDFEVGDLVYLTPDAKKLNGPYGWNSTMDALLTHDKPTPVTYVDPNPGGYVQIVGMYAFVSKALVHACFRDAPPKEDAPVAKKARAKKAIDNPEEVPQ